jgi:glycine cleavage system aminomethyltransferase T
MNADSMAPVRRSALEAVHTRIGRGWPMSYGDLEAERRVVAEAVGLAEPGLYDKWLLRGSGALAACHATGLEGRAGFVTPAPVGGINVWAIADDEVWLVAYAPTQGGPTTSVVDFGATVAQARRTGIAATDLSSGWAILRLFGPAFRDLLEELVAADLSPAAFADLQIAQVPLAGCRVILHRRDTAGIPGATMLVARDDVEYLWDVLLHVGDRHGIWPVGATALQPPAPVAAAPSEPPADASGKKR